MWQTIGGTCRRLLAHEGGAVLIYVSIALTVFMGFAALVIDGGRLFTLDTEMQSAADALALTGAAELDQRDDAITRATAAMEELVQNNQTFATGNRAVSAYQPTFLKSLPSDSTPISTVKTSTYTTTDPTKARFVLVELTGDDSRSMDTLFASAINGGSTASAGAVAIAGFNQAVCKFTPLFICNPYADTQSLLDALDNGTDRGKLIRLKRWASSDASPGNFGYLQPKLSQRGAKALGVALASINPGQCFIQTGVDVVQPQQGNIASANDAINTRFDMYQGSFGNTNGTNNDTINYPPAANVTKGYIITGSGRNAACNKNKNVYTSPPAYAFPLDSNVSHTSTNYMGNGNWDRATYWTKNHTGSQPAGYSTMSRYDVYRWENNNQIPNHSGENGAPKCGQAYTADDRRVIYAAVLQCPISPGNSGGPYPVLSFVKLFMTRPVDNSPDVQNDLYVEMIGKVEQKDAVTKDIVQLYR